MTVIYRGATAADLPAIAFADGAAFAIDYSEQDLQDAQLILQLDRFHLATEDDDVIGVAGDYSFTMTVPGGFVDVPGVTWVSVRATHRRRGILRELMHRQLTALREEGCAAAVLTASEGGIYGRFGYGAASSVTRSVIDTAKAVIDTTKAVIDTTKAAIATTKAAFATTPETAGAAPGVTMMSADRARALAPEVHRRWCAQTPGALSRSAAWWDYLFLDRESQRDGMSGLRYYLHRDGYVFCRTRTDWNDGLPRHTCVITDYVAVTPEAHRALWDLVLNLDLYGSVETTQLPIDDPLRYLLTDGRQVQTTVARDGLWIRPLHIGDLLSQRRYALEVDIVLAVGDAMFGDQNYHLHGGPDGAHCRPTDSAADLRLDAATLGSIYLGGHRAQFLANAGKITGDPSAITRLDRAFLADRAPMHGTQF